jgi:hypothetical protein
VGPSPGDARRRRDERRCRGARGGGCPGAAAVDAARCPQGPQNARNPCPTCPNPPLYPIDAALADKAIARDVRRVLTELVNSYNRARVSAGFRGPSSPWTAPTGGPGACRYTIWTAPAQPLFAPPGRRREVESGRYLFESAVGFTQQTHSLRVDTVACPKRAELPLSRQLLHIRYVLPTVRITESPAVHHGCAYIPRQIWRVIVSTLKTRGSEHGVP